jgi:hypothetical protein
MQDLKPDTKSFISCPLPLASKPTTLYFMQKKTSVILLTCHFTLRKLIADNWRSPYIILNQVLIDQINFLGSSVSLCPVPKS